MQGVEDLLLSARGHPERVIPCLKNCTRFIRNALDTMNLSVVVGVFKAIQQLVQVGPGVGEALLPYSKMFLSPISSFLDMTRNIGDSIDYGQRRNDDIGEEVEILSPKPVSNLSLFFIRLGEVNARIS